MVPFVRELLENDGGEVAGWFLLFLASLLVGWGVRLWWQGFAARRRESAIEDLRAERNALRLRVRELERERAESGRDA